MVQDRDAEGFAATLPVVVAPAGRLGPGCGIDEPFAVDDPSALLRVDRHVDRHADIQTGVLVVAESNRLVTGAEVLIDVDHAGGVGRAKRESPPFREADLAGRVTVFTDRFDDRMAVVAFVPHVKPGEFPVLDRAELCDQLLGLGGRFLVREHFCVGRRLAPRVAAAVLEAE